MKRKRLGEILLDAGAITPQQLYEALQDQKRYGGKLGNILLDRRFINEKEFFRALTSQLRIPAIDFGKSTVPEAVIKCLPRDLAEKYTVFPVALKQTPKGRVLVLAMGDPTNVSIQDEVQFTTGFKVEPVLALESTLRYVIRDYFFDRNGQGSYRLETQIESEKITTPLPDARVGTELPDAHSPGAAFIEHEPDRDLAAAEETAEAHEAAEDRPQLTRELKALLKLLAKKGILTPKEYLDEFFNTE